MIIILATPIYPPDIGGPATYSKKLKERLEQKKILVNVLSYGGIRSIPQPLRIIVYFGKLFKKSQKCDIIFAFNVISCGIPACICSKLLRRKFFIRIGGDFLWERAVEQGRTKETLTEYYNNPKKNIKEKFWIIIIRNILRKADKVIFTSNFQKQIYLKYYKIKELKTVVVPNPFPDIESNSFQKIGPKYQILFAGRILKIKNLEFLIKVYYNILEKTNKEISLKIVGEGPEKEKLKKYDKVEFIAYLQREDLLEEIKKSYICVLPSLTEISPNFALECIALRKPIILTKENGLEGVNDSLMLIDPKDQADLERKILFLLKEENYLKYLEKLQSISKKYSWDDIIKTYEKSFIFRSN